MVDKFRGTRHSLKVTVRVKVKATVKVKKGFQVSELAFGVWLRRVRNVRVGVYGLRARVRP